MISGAIEIDGFAAIRLILEAKFGGDHLVTINQNFYFICCLSEVMLHNFWSS